MTSKDMLLDVKKRNETLKREGHFHIGEISMKVIEKLVERDTPKKVVKEVDFKYVDTKEFYERDSYKCSNCNNVLIIDRYQRLEDKDKINHCGECGQRLDWS